MVDLTKHSCSWIFKKTSLSLLGKNNKLNNLFSFFSLIFKDDLENAKYISRLFASRHKFYKQNKICTEWVLLLHSCFLTPCFGIGLSFGMSGFVQFWGFFWLFFLVMYVSYSFPVSLFFLICFNRQQEQTVENEISFWALWALMLRKQPNPTESLESKALVSAVDSPEC